MKTNADNNRKFYSQGYDAGFNQAINLATEALKRISDPSFDKTVADQKQDLSKFINVDYCATKVGWTPAKKTKKK